jgi:hypothetical protein
VQSPVIDGKRLSGKSIEKAVTMATGAVLDDIEPMVYDIYDYHDATYLRRQAKLAPGDFTKDEWVEKLLGNKTAAYEREGALYKQYRDSKLRSILTNEAYEAINGRIIEAIRQNQNPDETIRRVREDVFGLKPGERNKGITYKAERLVRTELSHAETLSEKEVLRQNKDIIGVRIRYYGGPCSNGLCLDHLHNGVNFQSSGEEATADFYDKDGVDWPPYHPNCYCGVARYLYVEDLEEAA